MESHRLHFIITILTISMVASFCISITSITSTMETATTATTSSVVDSDSPLPSTYSDDQEEVHQEQPFNNSITLLQTILNNLDDLASPAVNPSFSSDDSAGFTTLKFILVGVFGGLSFVGSLLLVCLCIRNRGIDDQRGIVVGGQELSFRDMEMVLTFRQIRKATRKFRKSNLIKRGRSGDFFRGVLENGTPVVIKRINLNSLQRQEWYMVELGLFRRRVSSHTRLATPLGHCSDQENQRFLIYNIWKGDLFNSLYWLENSQDRRMQSLDWSTRMKIAVGVAEGLCYLHHECSPPLVHRDVRASSILLDDDYEASLGSLGKVCTPKGYQQNVISMLRRLIQTSSEQTPRSSPPATCAYDVYCFGLILVGLVTGKLGICESFYTTTNKSSEEILPSISIRKREAVRGIMQQNLIVNEDQLEEVWAIAIVAKSCLHRTPSKRPLMTYILKALKNPLEVTRVDNKPISARFLAALGMKLSLV